MPTNKRQVNRRRFLKGAAAGAAGAAAAALNVPGARAQQAGNPVPSATAPSASALNAEAGTVPAVEVLTVDRPGSDFMLDVIKSLDIEYVAANPGSSFRSLHESIVNYGGNRNPELLTCLHEESSVAMADGYAKVEGKPMAVMAHGTVGVQHASMAIYNAFCARVPVYIVLGNALDATQRRPGVEWTHSVQDAVAMVRDYIKWDDVPMSLPHFAESAVRAYKIAMTPPMGPVAIVVDHHLQESPIAADATLRVPKLTQVRPPQGDSGAVAEVARLLVSAENPVLIAGNVARTPEGMRLMVELAETLQAPVMSGGRIGGERNMPSHHPLRHDGGALIANADVIVGLEVADFWGRINAFRDQHERTSRPVTKAGVKLVNITSGDLSIRSNYQDFQRYAELDIAIAADGEATLPSLIEACRRLITADHRRRFDERGRQLAAAREQTLARLRTEATYAWNASPISTARLSAELWEQIKNKDWALVAGTGPDNSDIPPLWKVEQFHQTIAGAGGAGCGYGAAGSVGAALAHRKFGRLCVSFQNDGDLMYAPGVLWTAAHHGIPLLYVMHNNRGYHQEVMHVQRMANRHQRGITNAAIGNVIDSPNIDYAGLAKALGLYAEGPITNPNDLAPAIRRGIEAVERGQVALLDVVTQPR